MALCTDCPQEPSCLRKRYNSYPDTIFTPREADTDRTKSKRSSFPTNIALFWQRNYILIPKECFGRSRLQATATRARRVQTGVGSGGKKRKTKISNVLVGYAKHFSSPLDMCPLRPSGYSEPHAVRVVKQAVRHTSITCWEALQLLLSVGQPCNSCATNELNSAI